MKALIDATPIPIQTMSSIDLLKVINDARTQHGESFIRANDFHARVVDELEGEDYESFVVQNLNKTTTKAFLLNKDQCTLVAMRESKGVRRNVLHQLKQLGGQALAVPQDLPAALRLAADLAEKNQSIEYQLAIVAPKAQILDRIASGKNMLCLQDAAKHLHVSCKHLINTLANNKWIYRRATSSPHRKGSWTAYEQLTRKGCLYHDYAEANGEMRAQVLITEKGLIEAAKLLGVTA